MLGTSLLRENISSVKDIFFKDIEARFEIYGVPLTVAHSNLLLWMCGLIEIILIIISEINNNKVNYKMYNVLSHIL